MITYPNQKIIHINKPTYTGNYLSVGNDEWMAACNKLTFNGFKLFLYLAGNRDNFDLALSPKAIQQKIKMSDGTYTNIVKELIREGYLVNKQGNIYNFYTTPLSQSVVIYQPAGGCSINGMGDTTILEYDNMYHSTVGEINNIPKKANLNIDADAQEEKVPSKKEKEPDSSPKRQLDELSDIEIMELMQHYKKGTMRYPEMYKHYNLEYGLLDKNIIRTLESIQRNRNNDAKGKKNLEAAAMFGLSISDANELAKYLTGFSWEEWGEYAEDNMNGFLEGKINTAQGLLNYLREHNLSTHEIYTEYIPKNTWDSKEKIYKYYDEYLADCIDNPDETFLFAQNCIDRKNKWCQIS